MDHERAMRAGEMGTGVTPRDAVAEPGARQPLDGMPEPGREWPTILADLRRRAGAGPVNDID